MKEVLVIYYSQSGQLWDIAQNLVATLDKQKVNITYYRIRPEKDFDFPWTQADFYDAFPETFLQLSCALHPPEEKILEKKYDLVILGYQVWYLTPSIPINSFLTSSFAKQLLNNTPVVTVIACRNMWLMAQEKMKRLLLDCNAKLVGNIALVDRHINHISVITIVHWMMGGKKTKYLGIFPKPGVSEADIQGSAKFGVPINKALLSNSYGDLQNELLKLDAVHIKPLLIQTDKRGNILFTKWANLIIKSGASENGKRKKLLVLFKYYLLFAIWAIAPLVFIVFLITYIPRYKTIKREKEYYSSVRLKNN
ncbi:dialkylresorcinol condensing enzyme DarA [Arenibacter sp. H213]|uniref:Flavodoxin n=1 Tax=Arenibacter antarcticus TaxID=2040469 RepID=A0ABW5VKB3_9FLAO|nr:dialkylrecorsinol condensing enzyme DarA [Arenibacter sp. H213]MCM4169040.1 dialkylresorcinol condensing enzyme DarA [Arenibacter sp. H213]